MKTILSIIFIPFAWPAGFAYGLWQRRRTVATILALCCPAFIAPIVKAFALTAILFVLAKTFLVSDTGEIKGKIPVPPGFMMGDRDDDYDFGISGIKKNTQEWVFIEPKINQSGTDGQDLRIKTRPEEMVLRRTIGLNEDIRKMLFDTEKATFFTGDNPKIDSTPKKGVL